VFDGDSQIALFHSAAPAMHGWNGTSKRALCFCRPCCLTFMRRLLLALPPVVGVGNFSSPPGAGRGRGALPRSFGRSESTNRDHVVGCATTSDLGIQSAGWSWTSIPQPITARESCRAAAPTATGEAGAETFHDGTSWERFDLTRPGEEERAST
jgi:hypothetical protein